jgi:hypothetical protein
MVSGSLRGPVSFVKSVQDLPGRSSAQFARQVLWLALGYEFYGAVPIVLSIGPSCRGAGGRSGPTS